MAVEEYVRLVYPSGDSINLVGGEEAEAEARDAAFPGCRIERWVTGEFLDARRKAVIEEV